MILNGFETHMKVRKGAIHVGGNIGEERDWYVYNDFTKVLWFEPNPVVFEELHKNLETYPNQLAINLGIHDTLRKAHLNIANNRGQSSSLLDFGTHAIYHPDVKHIGKQEITLMRMDDFFDLSGRSIEEFNFLNVDTEGTELNVIKSFGDLIGELDYIYTEVRDEEVYKGCSVFSEIDYYLAQYGFERIMMKITKGHWGDAFYTKKNDILQNLPLSQDQINLLNRLPKRGRK